MVNKPVIGLSMLLEQDAHESIYGVETLVNEMLNKAVEVLNQLLSQLISGLLTEMKEVLALYGIGAVAIIMVLGLAVLYAGLRMLGEVKEQFLMALFLILVGGSLAVAGAACFF